jgi:transcriptional regulator with XRE-family HTH domain
MREIANGRMPTIAEADVDAYLAAPTALAFWRKHRGMTQVELSHAAGISQPYLAQLENSQREATVAVYARLAKILRVRIDDLVVEARAD